MRTQSWGKQSRDTLFTESINEEKHRNRDIGEEWKRKRYLYIIYGGSETESERKRKRKKGRRERGSRCLSYLRHTAAASRLLLKNDRVAPAGPKRVG